jgi:hypothetical protein
VRRQEQGRIPAASGRLEAFEVRTGVPQASASTTGIPHPSYTDG